MLRTSILLLVVASLLAPVARAQSLDDILAKHYAAQGGLDKLQKVQTMRVTGKMTAGPGMEIAFTMDKKRPNLMRQEFTLSGMTGSMGWDGTHGWQFIPMMGQKKPEPMSDDDGKQFQDQADFDGALVDWKAKGHTVELVGKESVEGADAFKLKVTKKNGQVDFYFLDAETYLIMKVTGKRTVHGTEVEGESTFGDYKDVKGLMYAFSMSNGVAGSPQKQAMTFDTIELDVPMDAAHFAMPAAPDSTGAAKPDSAKAVPAKKK